MVAEIGIVLRGLVKAGGLSDEALSVFKGVGAGTDDLFKAFAANVGKAGAINNSDDLVKIGRALKSSDIPIDKVFTEASGLTKDIGVMGDVLRGMRASVDEVVQASKTIANNSEDLAVLAKKTRVTDPGDLAKLAKGVPNTALNAKELGKFAKEMTLTGGNLENFAKNVIPVTDSKAITQFAAHAGVKNTAAEIKTFAKKLGADESVVNKVGHYAPLRWGKTIAEHPKKSAALVGGAVLLDNTKGPGITGALTSAAWKKAWEEEKEFSTAGGHRIENTDKGAKMFPADGKPEFIIAKDPKTGLPYSKNGFICAHKQDDQGNLLYVTNAKGEKVPDMRVTNIPYTEIANTPLVKPIEERDFFDRLKGGFKGIISGKSPLLSGTIGAGLFFGSDKIIDKIMPSGFLGDMLSGPAKFIMQAVGIVMMVGSLIGAFGGGLGNKIKGLFSGGSGHTHKDYPVTEDNLKCVLDRDKDGKLSTLEKNIDGVNGITDKDVDDLAKALKDDPRFAKSLETDEKYQEAKQTIRKVLLEGSGPAHGNAELGGKSSPTTPNKKTTGAGVKEK